MPRHMGVTQSHNETDNELPRYTTARLAQSVEHGTLNPRVVGSSPTLGANHLAFLDFYRT